MTNQEREDFVSADKRNTTPEKHTPGPWTDNYRFTPAQAHLEIYATPGARCIAKVFNADFSHGEKEANARLIAAAPELLEALKNLYTWCADDTSAFAILQQTRNVIAKVVGEESLTDD